MNRIYFSKSVRTIIGGVNRCYHDFSHVKDVAIIGAGVAGLQTANQLASSHNVTLFERTGNVGGVWRDNYADFGLQVPKELYEFPEFSWDQSGLEPETFPRGPVVQKYIESYVDATGLKDNARVEIKFDTIVQKVESTDAGEGSPNGWTVHTDCGSSQSFDFVIVCTGMYDASAPKIPQIPGQEQFVNTGGQVFHCSQFTDQSVIGDEAEVVVVGGGKSAIDCAVVSAKETNRPVKLVCREVHWPVPRYLLNLVPFKWGTYSRFGHFMLHKGPEVSGMWKAFHTLMTPLKKTWWAIVETMFKAQFRLGLSHRSSELVPASNIEIDVFNGGQILNYEYRDMLKTGDIELVTGSMQELKGNRQGVVKLADGTEKSLEADVLIYGTGFKKSYDIFPDNVQAQFDLDKDDGLYLFRNIIPANCPNLAFVGSEVSTFNNILTHYLQAVWLKRVLDPADQMTLPAVSDMEAQVEKEKSWKKSWMPSSPSRAALLQLHMMTYHDKLMRDMGESNRRKGNPVAEVFAPYNAGDYSDLSVSTN